MPEMPVRPSRAKVRWGWASIVVLASGAALLSGVWRSLVSWPETELPEIARSFDGDSYSLQRTQIVPTLDTPMKAESNVVWCSTFQLAWHRLQKDIFNEAIRLEGDPPEAGFLSNAPDPAVDLPEGAYYAAAARGPAGADQIRREMAERFPDHVPLAFPLLEPDSPIAYAFLQTQMDFTFPYDQKTEPMLFNAGDGQQTPVRAFGIFLGGWEREGEDPSAQVEVLYRWPEGDFGADHPPRQPEQFALDLCRTCPDVQLVVARVEPRVTLAETLADLEAKMKSWNPPAEQRRFSPADTLLVPDQFWRIRHTFGDLQGRPVLNHGMEKLPLALARQIIAFGLDRQGVRLESEAGIAVASIPQAFHLDRPFLLYLKKRGAERPFLVMWLENAELLQAWKR